MISSANTFSDSTVVALCFGDMITLWWIVNLYVKVILDVIHQRLEFLITIDLFDEIASSVVAAQYDVYAVVEQICLSIIKAYECSISNWGVLRYY